MFAALVYRVGLGEGARGVDTDIGVDLAIDGVDAVERGLDKLAGGDFAVLQPGAEIVGGGLV